jgi:hypothetical protein
MEAARTLWNTILIRPFWVGKTHSLIEEAVIHDRQPNQYTDGIVNAPFGQAAARCQIPVIGCLRIIKPPLKMNMSSGRCVSIFA